MAINFDLVGKPLPPLSFSYVEKDVILYALGVGAHVDHELDFVFEGAGHAVLPTFAVVPSLPTLLDACRRLDIDLKMIVHGEQTVIQHQPIAPRGTLSTTAQVTGIYDKGKGALAVVEATTTDDSGAPVFDNVFSVFVRGAGGFGGERGPQARDATPPDRAPDFEHTEGTSPDQAALYRLSGDLNPLHISPDHARKVGFDRPILHGLCTYGVAGRAILRHACGGDVAAFRSFAARFTAPVFPGDSLTTRGWKIEPDTYVISVSVGDTVVLGNAVARIYV